MMMKREQIEQMPAGPEMNALIEAEIFNAIPLTDEEWDLCRATWMMAQGPYSAAGLIRPLKFPLDEPQYETKLMFRLQCPGDYSSDVFSSSRRIVDKMRADGWLFSLHDGRNNVGEVYKLAQFVKECKATQEEIEDCKAYRGIITIRGEGLADTDVLAIIRAALNAKLALNERGEK